MCVVYYRSILATHRIHSGSRLAEAKSDSGHGEVDIMYHFIQKIVLTSECREKSLA